jgi:hypothetical protein
MSATNPFATEEAWDVSTGTILAGDLDTGYGKGNHLCTVDSIDGAGSSSGGHPQVEINCSNEQGQIRDWIVVIPQTIGKVVNFTDACGLERPTDEQVRPDGTGFRLDPQYLAQAVGKQVGVIVRKERNDLDPSKPDKDRVKGYVTPDKLNASGGATPTGAAEAFAKPANTQAPIDDDIPF